MTCAWKEFLSILPPRLRKEADRQGKDTLQEIRLRINSPPELTLAGKLQWISGEILQEDLDYIINSASSYSPWCASTLSQGFLTAPGGHRIGVCGTAVCKNGTMEGVRDIQSVMIRIARDFPGIAKNAGEIQASTLIIGAPGWGKTTLLRDVIRSVSLREEVAVVDERGELFPEGFHRGNRTDILTGCPKSVGIELLLRTMGPDWIAVDEITAERDCQALIQAANCGVRLLATAHAGSIGEFRKRSVYRTLLSEQVFDSVLVLKKDKSYTMERMRL